MIVVATWRSPRLHSKIVDDAAFLCGWRTTSVRALSAEGQGVVQPKSWFIDIATMSV